MPAEIATLRPAIIRHPSPEEPVLDPLSQAVLGASAAQSGASAHEMRAAAVVGLLGGMAPDLDVLIRSTRDTGNGKAREFTRMLPGEKFSGFQEACCSIISIW